MDTSLAIGVLGAALVNLGLLRWHKPRSDWLIGLNLTVWTAVVVVPILGEVTLRAGIGIGFPAVRRPALYADWYSDDDYWLLQQRWDRRWRHASPERVHEVLGWSRAEVTPSNPLGLNETAVARLATDGAKALFFGDSFVRGSAERAYQLPEYLNDRLSGEATVVDVSVNGYGLDQIYLLFRELHPRAAGSLFLVGILTNDDLDRTVLTVRTSQKPYFVPDERGALELRGVPIQRDQAAYFENARLTFRSFFLASVRQRLLGSDRRLDAKKRISTSLISRFLDDARKANSEIVFVLFYTERGLREDSWQEQFLLATLRQAKARFVDTKPLLLQHATASVTSLRSLYVPGDGHHNSTGNRVIGDGILQYVETNRAELLSNLRASLN